MYLLRIIGPHIRLYSQQFDHMMDMLFGQYFNINLSAPAQLDSIPINSNALTHQHAMQLARIQLRGLPSDGGMNYLALDATTSYTAAHVRHMQKLVNEAVSGPYILPPSASTCLFSDPFRNTYADLTARGAAFLRTDVCLRGSGSPPAGPGHQQSQQICIYDEKYGPYVTLRKLHIFCIFLHIFAYFCIFLHIFA